MKLRALLLMLTLLALLSAIAGAYMYYISLEKGTSEREHMKNDTLVSDIAEQLDIHIVERQKMLRVLAESDEFGQALLNRKAGAIAKAEAVLDRACDTLEIENVIYLMDITGLTVASSNRDAPDNFIGSNYAFRPYFLEAIKGKPSVYMALGATSNKRGIYYSQPVYGDDRSSPAGVLVVKVSTEGLQLKMDLLAHSVDGVLLLTDPHGLVFLSNREDWVYHLIWETSPEKLRQLASTEQFGSGPWKWTGLKRISSGHAIDASGRKYHIHTKQIINYPGWEVTLLQDESAVGRQIISSLLAGGGYMVLPLLLVVLPAFFVLYRIADKEIIVRRASEEKAVNTALEWDRTFNSISDPVSVHSRDFRIIRANKAMSDFLGMKNEDIIGKHCYQLFHGTDCPVAGCPNVKTIESKLPVTTELHDKISGKHLIVTTSPILNKQNRVIGTIHTVKNITEMKKLEIQLVQAQKMESIGQLAGGVAHDFNNILGGIINYNFFLRDMTPGDTDYLNTIDKIYFLAERASHITRSLLSYSRKQVFDLRPMNINGILRNIDQLLRPLIGKDIDVVTLPAKDDLFIMADENHIGQCFMNLASNARDAMPGGGTFTITTEVIEINMDFIISHGFGIPGAYALMSVTDTGTGMDEATRLKIFEPFFTTKEVGKGTGLGLSMVFGIIKQHEGFIDVYGNPGHGSTFKLYFPLIKEDIERTKENEYTPVTGGTENI